MAFLKRHNLFALFLLVLLAFPTKGALAAAPVGFGHEYGLFVRAENGNLTVPAAKGLQVLDSYFVGSPLKASAPESTGFMSQRDFILTFEKLRRGAFGNVSDLDDESLYQEAWLRARHNNWLPNAKLTFQSMQEFLYRYAVSRANGGHPYYDGLVLDPKDINTQRFASLNQIREVLGQIETHQQELQSLNNPTSNAKQLLATLNTNYAAFEELEGEIRAMKHPLNLIPDLPEDIHQKIIDNDLNEVLGSISYDYSKNNSNRIHNLTTGLAQLSGKVFQPGETFDFTEILGEDGWGIYQYGWVILGGVEAWEFGGGLCGSATMTFTPSWRAGLEIIKRYPHSRYYSNLYPEESLGLDATIYRGGKNLIMRNSTASPILYYIKNEPEKKEVTLYLIGNSPYLSVEIEGPIKTGTYAYKWIRRMQRFDGTIIEDEITTSYGRIY